MGHLSEAELSAALITAAQAVKVGATYRHYKGNSYLVKELLIIEATNEVGVVYQAQYGEKITFVRPLSVWNEVVEHNGALLPRFARIP